MRLLAQMASNIHQLLNKPDSKTKHTLQKRNAHSSLVVNTPFCFCYCAFSAVTMKGAPSPISWEVCLAREFVGLLFVLRLHRSGSSWPWQWPLLIVRCASVCSWWGIHLKVTSGLQSQVGMCRIIYQNQCQELATFGCRRQNLIVALLVRLLDELASLQCNLWHR